MFESYTKSQAPSGLRWTIPVGALVVAILVVSTILVPKLFPAQVRQAKKLVEPLFFPAVKVAEVRPEAPKSPTPPTGPQRPTVRVVSNFNPYAPPRVVPTVIITDVPEVFVPPNSRVGDLPTATACPPGATCVFGNEPVSVPPPPPVVKPVAPKEPAKPERISVSTGVQAAKLTSQPKPAYPDLARKARIQGVVRLTAIISKDGSIQNLTLVSGHPLLVSGAMEAVRRWRYEPTLLNGEPVEVITQIDVNFTLTQ